MIYQTEETRERILIGAQKLFVQNGYAETQMKDIAVEVGISRHSLYRYYRDKADLGFAIVERTLDHLFSEANPIREELSQDAALKSREVLIGTLMRWYTEEGLQDDHRFLAEFDAFHSGVRITNDFVERLPQKAMESGFASLDALVRRGIADGSIRDDIPASELLRTVFYSMKAVVQLLVLRGSVLYGVSKEQQKRFLSNFCAILDDGLRPTGIVSDRVDET